MAKTREHFLILNYNLLKIHQSRKNECSKKTYVIFGFYTIEQKKSLLEVSTGTFL